MIITWHGEGALKIVDKETTIAVNPHDGTTDKMPSFSAALGLIGGSFATDKPLREQPFLVTGPGEYEVKGVFVYGVHAKGVDGPVTVFLLEIDGVTMAHLGGIQQDQLTQEQLEVLEGADVLFVPVGGKNSLNAKQAIKMINQIEPRIIVPIDYKTAGSKSTKDGVEPFLKEYGAEKKHDKIDKLKLTKKDLPQEDSRVIIIEQS